MREAEGIDEGTDPSTQESPAPGDRGRRVVVDGVEYVPFESARKVFLEQRQKIRRYKGVAFKLEKEIEAVKEKQQGFFELAEERGSMIRELNRTLDRVKNELYVAKKEVMTLRRNAVVRTSQSYNDLEAENKQLGDRIAQLEKVNRGYDAKLEAIKKVVDDSNINRRQLRERIAAINTLPGALFLTGTPMAYGMDYANPSSDMTAMQTSYRDTYPRTYSVWKAFQEQNSCNLCTRIHDELVVNPDCLKHGVNQAWRNGLRS